MALTGTFDATYGGHPFDLRLNIAVVSQDPVANQSTINWNLQTIKTGAFTPSRSDAAATWAFNVIGSGNWGPYNFNGAIGQAITMVSGSFVATHNSDGTLSFPVVWSANADSTITTASGSNTMVVDTIPRATQPTVSPVSGNTDSAYTIGVVPASSAFYHDIYYSLDGGATYTSIVANLIGTTTTQAWTPASSLLPNASSVNAIIRVDTRSSSGGSIIGTKTVTLPLAVPSSIVPTISSVSVVDAQVSAPNMPSLMGAAGRFVQGWSKLQPTITSSGASGSSIIGSSVYCNGQSTASGSAFGTAVGLSGAVPYIAQVEDSRLRLSAAYNNTVAVTAYSAPKLPTPTITRTSDAAGLIPSPAGTYLAIAPLASVSDLTFGGSQKNLLEYQIRTMPVGGSWTTVTAWTAAGGITWTTKQILTGYAASTAWLVEVSVRDLFSKNGYSSPAVLTVPVPTEAVFMDWDEGIGIGLGKYRDQTAGLLLDVQGDAHFSGQLKQNTGLSVLDTSSGYTQTAANSAIAAAVALANYLVPNTWIGTDLALNYPVGDSTMLVYGTAGWPDILDGTVVTHNPVAGNGGAGAAQWYFSYQAYKTYYRQCLYPGTAWGPWRQVAELGKNGSAFAQAAGTVTPSGATTVTLPSGRFSVAPIIQATQNSPALGVVVQISSVTATSFVITVANSSGGVSGVACSWTATQMTATTAAG